MKYINLLQSHHDQLLKNGSDLNNDISVSFNNLQNLKAIALYNTKDFDSAQRVFDELLIQMKNKFYKKELNKYDEELYVNILKSSIGCARDSNNVDKVIDLVQEYIEIFSNDYNGYSLLGEAFTIANKYNDALKVYLKANSLFPDNTDIQKKIATMFTLLGNEKS